MKEVAALFILLAGLGGASRAFAGAMVEANVLYFSDTFTYDDQARVYKRTFWDICLALPLTKKQQLALGWSYGSMTFSDNPLVEEALAVKDMGPKIIWFLDKELTWEFALTYNLITNGTYTGTTGETKLRGTSIKAEFGFVPMLWEGFHAGIKLNYYKVSFKEEIRNETDLEQVTHSRTSIYPSIAIVGRW